MDADPELDAAVLWQAGIALDHAVLDLDRAANSVHDAAEFDDRSIACALDDTTVMYGNCGIDQIATQGSQPRENSVLVGPGKAAVTDHIGNKDRGKLAKFLHHTLPPETPATTRLSRSASQTETLPAIAPQGVCLWQFPFHFVCRDKHRLPVRALQEGVADGATARDAL